MKSRKNNIKNMEDRDYLIQMSRTDDMNNNWLSILPIIVFTAFVILVVRIHNYTAPMEQFYWTNMSNDTVQSDFFSYCKLIVIIVCTLFAFLHTVFRFAIQSAEVKRSKIYIPLLVYIVFVIFSFLFSSYKEFAWMGYNDRFEGCVAIICYVFLLLFTINSIRCEWEVKKLIGALAISSLVLSLLGISQGLDHDFFRTTIGQKLLLPNVTYEDGSTLYKMIDEAAKNGEQVLNFTFKNKEIYQTVYNINYVSFYLTLLVPIFGMLFINLWNRGKYEPVWKKIAVAALFGLIMYNFIGSQSSGGLIGLAVIGSVGLLIFNKKIVEWVKPLGILLVITGLVAGATMSRWAGELSHSVDGFGEDSQKQYAFIDYFETTENGLNTSLDGKALSIALSNDETGRTKLLVNDDSGSTLASIGYENAQVSLDAYGYRGAVVALAVDGDSNSEYILLDTDGKQWPFLISPDGTYYLSGTGKYISLSKIEHKGFENHYHFGSGRGYIWSATIPMLKSYMLLGSGPDTYCLVYPQNDYAGKYSMHYHSNPDIIIDKPHNMYWGMWINTGFISVVAWIAMIAMYSIQSVKIYRRKNFKDEYLYYIGSGIFLGCLGFAFSGLVNDSTVSTMPMFYGLLGTGIAINWILEKENRDSDTSEVKPASGKKRTA